MNQISANEKKPINKKWNSNKIWLKKVKILENPPEGSRKEVGWPCCFWCGLLLMQLILSCFDPFTSSFKSTDTIRIRQVKQTPPEHDNHKDFYLLFIFLLVHSMIQHANYAMQISAFEICLFVFLSYYL